MATRCLVTGGAGLIGSHLTDLLVQRGYDVRVFDNLEPQTHPEAPDWLNPGAEFVRGDVRDRGAVGRAARGCELVFHQAAFGGFAPNAARKMTATNCLGTANVLAASKNARKVVVASSQAVYGPDPRPEDQLKLGVWGSTGGRLSEDSPTFTPSPYALSKLYAERLSLMADVPAVALRYALTYGPRQSVTNPYTGICSIFSTRLLNGLPPLIYEDGQQTRDFTYVEDVARANLLVAEDPVTGVFNVGTGVATTVEEFALTLADTYGVGIGPEITGAYRPQDARSTVTDPAKLKALGWEPQVGVREGVRRYAEWIATRPRPEETLTAALPGLREAGVVCAR